MLPRDLASRRPPSVTGPRQKCHLNHQKSTRPKIITASLRHRLFTFIYLDNSPAQQYIAFVEVRERASGYHRFTTRHVLDFYQAHFPTFSLACELPSFASAENSSALRRNELHEIDHRYLAITLAHTTNESATDQPLVETFAMPEVAVNSPLADALNGIIQPKLVEVGWGTGGPDDAALSEYVILMLVNGKTESQIAQELSGELLNLGPDDPAAVEFAKWLFEEVERLDRQLGGGSSQADGGAMEISDPNDRDGASNANELGIHDVEM